MTNTREKLIGLLETVPPLDAVIMGLRNGKQLISTSRVADHLIANGVTIQKWIPVSERLPEAHRLVLCRWTRGIGASYGFARYQHEGVWYVLNEGMPEVTHWMPLPEPPKGG